MMKEAGNIIFWIRFLAWKVLFKQEIKICMISCQLFTKPKYISFLLVHQPSVCYPVSAVVLQNDFPKLTKVEIPKYQTVNLNTLFSFLSETASTLFSGFVAPFLLFLKLVWKDSAVLNKILCLSIIIGAIVWNVLAYTKVHLITNLFWNLVKKLWKFTRIFTSKRNAMNFLLKTLQLLT